MNVFKVMIIIMDTVSWANKPKGLLQENPVSL